jgi:thiamine-phosphate pyrophosphorylase
MRTNVASLVRLMLVTDDDLIRGRDLVLLARLAQQGGVTALQVRLKHLSARPLTELVRRLMAAVDIPVLVNDRPDIALAAGAAGVHLGPEDMPVALARRIAPPGFIIGASVGSEAESKPAADADYWGVGPWRVTSTKTDAGAALGPSGFQRLADLAAGRPCIAIGGVLPDDVSTVAASGGAGVAVASGILATDDVTAAAGKYLKEIERWIPS